MGKHAMQMLLLAMVTSAVTACCSSETEQHLIAPEAVERPDTATVVTGTSRCDWRPLGNTFDSEGDEVIEERFVCETEMSDARATGIEEYPLIVTRVIDPDEAVGGTWTAEDTTLTTEDGVWRGSGYGVVDMVGVSPLAEGIWPFNYGEVHYVGEGAYDGLRMYLYISGTNLDFALAGWIVESG